MKKQTANFLGVLGIIMLLVLAGCTKTQSGQPQNTGASRYLVWNLASEPKSWDPTTNSESVADYMATQLFEGLTYITSDGTGPGVAETWDVSPDGKTYTFHLRKNAKWSDGSPVTAHDFEYSWRRICDPAVASDALQGMTDYVQGAQEYFDGRGTRDGVKATAADDYTFVVVLKSVTPYFPQLVANDIYMPVKKDIVESVGEGWEKDPKTCIGNGPFKLTEYQIGSHFIFGKNEHYWDAAGVKISGLRLLLIGDDNTSLQGYQAGEIDVTELLPAAEIPRLVAQDPNAVSAFDTGLVYLFFNCDKAPLNDLRVRKAITYAIDRKTIAEQVTRAGEIPATGVFSPTAEKTDGSSFRTLDSNGYPVPQYGIDPYKANVEEAKAQLAAAGYPDGRGFPQVEILYNSSNKWKAVTEAVQQMLKENLNISVTLRSVESSVYWDIMGNGEYQIGRGGWTNNPFNPSGLVKMLHSQNGNNSAQWRYRPYADAPWDTTLNPDNEAFDRAFDRALTLQGAESDAEWVKAEEAIMAALPIAPLYYPTMTYVVNTEKVRGVAKSPSLRWIFKNAEIIK
jgi:oligopeptide transport system substrate-binding protein